MVRHSKRYKKMVENFDATKVYSLKEAVEILKKSPPVKFDESVDVSVYLSVDPKKADQQVRGTVPLPHGTGKQVRVLVFCQGEAIQAALNAGADFAGGDDLVKKVAAGWTDFDIVVSTPDMMREVGKLGKVLGPRGLMPSPKAGTVTRDVASGVKEIKAGKVEYKIDKSAVINNQVAKMSFGVTEIVENAETLINAILKAKPSSAKGQYVKSCFLTSTMGPGIRIDVQSINT
jgi:large subunit ribosomal protein L1